MLEMMLLDTQKPKPPQYTTRSGRTVKKPKKFFEEDSPNGQSFKGRGSCEMLHAQNADWESSRDMLRKSVEQRAEKKLQLDS